MNYLKYNILKFQIPNDESPDDLFGINFYLVGYESMDFVSNLG